MTELMMVALTDASAASPLRQILDRVLGSVGARLGMAWVAAMVLLAVFSPFIASSHPLLMKSAGHWSSPVIRYMTPADLVLQVAFWTPLALWRIRIQRSGKILIWLGIVLLSMAPAAIWVRPPEPIVYQVYRQGQQDRSIERVILTIIPYSPDDHLRDQEDARLMPPDRQHWMGTTAAGADLLSNMIHATRIALSIGFISTGIGVVLGILVGGMMGYCAGTVDLLGMRLVEIFDSIPTLYLLLCFVAVFPPNLYIMMAIIGVTTFPSYAYFVRAEFLSLRDRDFVHAARAAGLPTTRILFRHMLINGMTPVIINASFGVASAILIESTLSFLGIGLVTESSWGKLLEEALGIGGTFYWWIAVYPGLAIFLTVFAYNLIGEALRDALDPKLRKLT